ncbi:hypothetical protein AHAS_Ahas19G0286400 [Arachis hypogaea]
MGSETLSFTPLKVSVFFIFFSPLPILSLCLSLLDLSHLSHCASHARSLPLSSLVSQSRSSPAFQRLAAFPVLLLAGNRSTRRIVVARHLLVSSNRRHESPWIVDCCRIFTCFVAHPLLGSGPLRHPVALGKSTHHHFPCSPFPRFPSPCILR